jgi:DNA-binding response OmpR family regulator
MLPTATDARHAPRPARPRAAFEEKNVVVVIDNDRAMRDEMVRFVGDAGYVAVSAWSGDEGLRLARDLGAAAIAMDVGLPGKDGWSVLAEIKRDPELAHTPVMLLAREQAGAGSALVGVEQFLTKPLSPTDLKVATAMHAEMRLDKPAVVVTHDETTRRTLEDALAEQGWRLLVAEDADGAQVVLVEEPGIVVLDLMMADLGGFSLVRRIVEEHPRAPVIALFSEALTPEDVFLLHKGVEQAVRYGPRMFEDLRSALERQVGPVDGP